MAFTFPHLTERLLSEVTTLGIGGPARYFAEARTVEEMRERITAASLQGIPFFILGKGSNCLFDDRGFNGLVVLNRIDSLREEGDLFSVGSGYSFARLGMRTATQGWEGLEFGAGIPATVGGAVYMNAGAQGKETQHALVSVEFLEPDGTVRTFARSELSFGYRTSSFHDRRGAILSATFRLVGNPAIKQEQQRLLHYRLETQPYKEKSAGCAFRNPPGLSAGALIDRCQLKGKSLGGARVSELHGNFILNGGGARARDVLQLMEEIQEEVFKREGILLQREIVYVPYE